MLFFDQTEQHYLNRFVDQHRQFIPTYFAPYDSLEAIVERACDDAYKYGYFLWQGTIALFKACISLYQCVYALIRFSFEEANALAIESASYFASSMMKYGFCLLSVCLDLVQQLSKSIFGFFYALFFTLCGESEVIKNDKKKEAFDRLKYASNSVSEKCRETNDIWVAMQKKSEALWNYSNLELDPRVVPISIQKQLLEGMRHLKVLNFELSKARMYLDDHTKAYDDQVDKNADIEMVEEFAKKFIETQTTVDQAARPMSQHMDFLLNLFDAIHSQSCSVSNLL